VRRKGHSAFYYWIDIGTKVPYAPIHEFGGTTHKGAVMPKRPFFVPGIKAGVPKANKVLLARFQRIF
jgi:phage gpG-like protein